MKIAITGHKPDTFLISHYSLDTVIRIANNTVCIFDREFKNDLVFNIGGIIGADQYVGMGCIEHGVKFKLYLPSHPTYHSKYWNTEQRSELNRQLGYASGIEIIEPNTKLEYDIKIHQERNIRMVDDANFVVAFWVGRKYGDTFDTMEYALSQSKFVFNALDNNRPIFKDDLKKGWTPPFLRGDDG